MNLLILLLNIEKTQKYWLSDWNTLFLAFNERSLNIKPIRTLTWLINYSSNILEHHFLNIELTQICLAFLEIKFEEPICSIHNYIIPCYFKCLLTNSMNIPIILLNFWSLTTFEYYLCAVLATVSLLKYKSSGEHEWRKWRT